MKAIKALEGGLAGAAALTLVHEAVRKVVPGAPRMDLLGMTALAKALKSLRLKVPNENKLYGWTLFGDLVSNALYYSLAGVGARKYILLRSLILGLTAGAGAIAVPKYTSLNENYSNRTKKTASLTLAWYLVGGLVAGAAMLAFSSSKKRKRNNSFNENLITTNPAELQRDGFMGM
jgi:hypothetical protein